ncbi:hypothetical protein GTZ99_12575 [Novosphingobium sp. FSY-8]|uniref:Uncharacterized protein n=1 Tax=Novosphingobium ovatum TaxID=1908523 RepID=A0ABW9XFR8_9SPHN|nr:hypothetical protein [Novosphingobium ovatum]NBC37386.1 hypothetical protein [Novosphingobium ovatum]
MTIEPTDAQRAEVAAMCTMRGLDPVPSWLVDELARTLAERDMLVEALEKIERFDGFGGADAEVQMSHFASHALAHIRSKSND